MEPIDYKRAITHRWPLILVCAIVGAIVAVLIPVHESATASETTYQAQALTGVSPAKSSNANAVSAAVSQIEFYAEQQPVYVATLKAAKLKGGVTRLRNDITLKSIKSKKKKVPPGSFYVQVTQPTKAGAASLANTFVKQLIVYANQQLAAQHAEALKQNAAEISSLESQLVTVDDQIKALTKKPTGTNKSNPPPTTTTTRPKSSTTTTTTTTTTMPQSHVPTVTGDAISAACSAIAAQGLACSPSSQFAYKTSTSVPEDDVITTAPGPGTALAPGSLVKLVISLGPQPPSTTTTASTTAVTTVVTTGVEQSGVATLLASRVALVQTKKKSSSSTTTSSTSSTSTSTTVASGDQLGPLQAKQKAVTGLLSAALQRQNSLQNEGTPTTGLTLLAPARASEAKAIPGTSNPFAHRSIRGLVGVVGGALIGVALALLLDALDKRLRKADRVAQVFDLPVIAEVPKSRARLGDLPRPAPKKSRKKKDSLPAPRPVPAAAFIAVTDDPTSIAAEAFRRLRVAVLFESGREPHAETDVDTLLSGDTGSANGRANGSAGFRRQVVLVVSPTLEPTVPEVVANLAAAYAEAGETALVVTTNDLRSKVGTQSQPSQWISTPEPPTIQTRVVEGGSPAVGAPPVGAGAGEPTQPIPAVGASMPVAPSLARDSRNRGSFTVEEVAAHCRPQQVHGVMRLELGELLRGPGEMATRGNEILEVTRQIADVVLVEVPSLLATPDAEAISRSADAIIVVAECFYTTVSQATRSAGLLRRISTPVLGVVLTEVEVSRKEQKRLSSAPPRADLKDAPAYAGRVGR